MNRLLTRQQIEREYGLPVPLLDELLRTLAPACTGDGGQALFLEAIIDDSLTQRLTAPASGPATDPLGEFMTTRDVAKLLACSYSEARERMLDGRIRAIKDGRWLRTRRAWVEEYVAGKTVKPPTQDHQDLSIPTAARRRGRRVKLKPGGMGLRFLRKLSK